VSYDRTPAADADRIWGRRATRSRWHQLWIAVLRAQVEVNPKHPGKDDIVKYEQAARAYADEHAPTRWDDLVDQHELQTRHDLQAELQVFNEYAGAHTAHMGLTSHDIVDGGTQIAIHDSLVLLIDRARQTRRKLSETAHKYKDLLAVGRTHGQPAQAIPYGYRYATLAAALNAWIKRAEWWQLNQPGRPPYGAVGTAADLMRVALSWDAPAPAHHRDLPHEIASKFLKSRYRPRLEATRQVYHRSQDIHTAALLVELASIAQTWATDRRLETMLGHGAESRTVGQVGSSAMPHKINPVLCERICSLAAIQRGFLTTAAELGHSEWLEGDVSGSAGRRHWLPGMFRTAEQILHNWAEATHRWTVDEAAITHDMHWHQTQLYTGAALQGLIERGTPREEAYRLVQHAASMFGAGASHTNLAEELAVMAGASDMRKAWVGWQLHTEYARDVLIHDVKDSG